MKTFKRRRALVIEAAFYICLYDDDVIGITLQMNGFFQTLFFLLNKEPQARR